MDTAAMASPRVRDSSTQAAVTHRTYRNVKIERGPPVAATTAVMSAVSSRQMNQVRRRDWAGGGSRSTAPAEASATSSASTMTARSPGTGPGETNGPSASRTAATPSRAQENPRSGPPTFSAPPRSLHKGDQTEDRQIHRHHEAADHHAQEDDHDGLEQGREGGDGGVAFAVEEVRDLGKHAVERAGILADADHVHDHRREYRAPLEGLRPSPRPAGPRGWR